MGSGDEGRVVEDRAGNDLGEGSRKEEPSLDERLDAIDAEADSADGNIEAAPEGKTEGRSQANGAAPWSRERAREALDAGRAWAQTSLNRWDAGMVAVAFACAARAVSLRWPPKLPFLTPEGDSAMLCTFAAAVDSPGRFARDAILSDPSNYDFYATVHVPWTRLMARVFGDYGIAHFSIMPALVFFQLLGFYLFGRTLYRSRLAAALLSLCCLFQIKIPTLSTYWGISGWTTARDWFQAFLPFVLAGAVASKDRPRRFIPVMVGAGLLMYLHPVSAPPWAFAIWCGLWFCLPADWTFTRRFRWMFGCGLVFLATAAPFVIKYLTAHESGAGAKNVEAVREIIAYRFLDDYTNVANASLKILRQFLRTGLPILALVGAASVSAAGSRDAFKRSMILVWGAVLVVFAFVIPIYEHDWAYRNGRLPFEYDLIRNCRYLYLLSLVFGLWPLALVAKRRQPVWAGALAVGILGLLVLRFPTPALAYDKNSVSDRFDKEKILPHHQRPKTPPEPKDATPSWEAHDEHAEAMLWVREHVPETALFLGHHRHDCLYLRYGARRAVAHCWKDGGVLAYSHFDRLQHWYDWEGRLRGIEKRNANAALPELVDAAKKLGADHVLVHGAVSPDVAEKAHAKPLYSNRRISVFELTP